MNGDDLETRLNDLIRQWQSAAESARIEAGNKRSGDIYSAYFFQGVTKTFQQAADDLRRVLHGDPPTPETAERRVYIRIPERDVRAMLEQIGLFARDVRTHSDGAFTAVFSRLQPFTQDRRIKAMLEADPRIVILDQGRLPDTNDPFIDFAFETPQNAE